MKKRALLSVYDKTDLVPFAKKLVKLNWELVASGGTAKLLQKNNIPVIAIADVTNAPEMLGGRVKTLHPAIHGGILAQNTPADRADLKKRNIKQIDLVVCNLYPFEETIAKSGVTLAQAVEQIDIGGVTLLRAAAKNFKRATIISDPADYAKVLAQLEKNNKVTSALRKNLAIKAFVHTRNYDTAIAVFLSPSKDLLPESLQLYLHKTQTLRYGENPHQEGALYSYDKNDGPLGGKLLQGKELSYNNLLDLDLAWRAVLPYKKPTVVIIKHLCPCGIATGSSLHRAFPKALASDPVSAFGSIIAVNRVVDMQFVASLAAAKLFVECIVAPQFTPKAQRWLAEKKKNCRLLVIRKAKQTVTKEFRSIINGVVMHEQDSGDPKSIKWKVASKRKPTTKELKALTFAWNAVQYVKSNAIVFAVPGATVGIGGGLTSRVDAVRLAATKAGDKSHGAVMASDAFFPFPDGVEEAAKYGVTAVIQPGGSIRDDVVRNVVNKYNMAMIYTGVRHFRH